MSLFLCALAFSGTPYEDSSRQGVIIGSLLSAFVGISIFFITGKRKKRNTTPDDAMVIT